MNMQISPGVPYPYGVSIIEDGMNFAFHAIADAAFLCFFEDHSFSPLQEIPLDPQVNRTGNTWHVLIKNLSPDLLYAFRVNGSSEYLSDPYAKEIATTVAWGKYTLDNPYRPFCRLPPVSSSFDWEGDQPPKLNIEDLIIYEMHVRGFTRHPSSQVKNPDTFLGLIEKIPYLLELGVNAIELLPIYEFDECETIRVPHLQDLTNYWGYSPVNFFCPMQRYVSSSAPHAALQEFKMMVKALHKAGIEVILDVVYNHTAEGDETGPHYSFKELDNAAYYILDTRGQYLNYSGCGNTFNTNHPITLDLILQSLRYWVSDMHVDGFRFDLASIFSRDLNGKPTLPSAIIQAITKDSILSQTKLIGEPWDAGGLYQVGALCYSTGGRWSEWNGRYRDAVRQFIKGTGRKGEFATSLCGSQNLYYHYTPCCSVNFVTCHDGFTLKDLVSYDTKHNLANREGNRDGINQNDSWNCGVEGETQDEKVLALRLRQMKNFHLALMVSRGIPMLHMGDEYGHSKQGNNNTWCQDNELNWFCWDQLKNNEFFHFYKKLIKLRKDHALFRKNRFLDTQEIVWHGNTLNHPHWEVQDQLVAFTLKDLENHEEAYVAFNASPQKKSVDIPLLPLGRQWNLVIQTANPPPQDFYTLEKEVKPAKFPATIELIPYSAILLLST